MINFDTGGNYQGSFKYSSTC